MRPFIRHQVCNGIGTFLWHDFFFFFWINKSLFPKGQSPTKNTYEVKKDPKNEKRTAPPLKQRKRGISPIQNTPDMPKHTYVEIGRTR